LVVIGFRSFVSQFFLSIQDPVIRRLYLLASLGEDGAYAGQLMRDFQQVGILHLLVISGSQVEHVVRGLRLGATGCLAGSSSNRGVQGLLGRAWIAGGLFLFGMATAWPPPLTRALLVSLLMLALPRVSWGVVFAVGFVLHLILFPSHARSVGFFLSWLASLLLKMTAELKWKHLWRSGIVTILTSVAAHFILPKAPALSIGMLLWACLANWGLGWFFDTALMPATGVVLAMGVILSPLGALAGRIGWSLGALAAPCLETVGFLLLVALGGFRYIRSP
jgi:hypothetical protein